MEEVKVCRKTQADLVCSPASGRARENEILILVIGFHAMPKAEGRGYACS
jgi:hypothetical protein